MTDFENKRYNQMENVLQYITKQYVTVNEEDKKRTSPILNFLIQELSKKMIEVSPLFKNLYESIAFGGSFYDNLKVGKPDEFDIDLRMVLPKLVEAKLEVSYQCGFVRLVMPGWPTLEKSNEFVKFSELAKFKDENNYLLQNKILFWMISTVQQALNKYEQIGKCYHIFYPAGNTNIEVTSRTNGPAVTLTVSSTALKILMDVDFVVSFKMTESQWPPIPFTALPSECKRKKDFLVIPKPPKNVTDDKPERLWRLSFQEQEKELMNGNERFKPVLRLIKKLRDTQNHKKISSYFLKTIFLMEVEKRKSEKEFWQLSLSMIFMHMLKTYRDYLKNGNIPYYWSKQNNLLQYIDNVTIENFYKLLTRVIDTVDKKINSDPYIIADFLLMPEELASIRSANIVISKKTRKMLQGLNCVSDEVINSQVLNINNNLSQSCQKSVITANNCNENNSNIIMMQMLKEMQNDIKKIQTDTKFILQKINCIELAIEEIKKDKENVPKNEEAAVRAYFIASGTVEPLDKKTENGSSCNML